jgi:hypothetical protein
VRSWSVPAHGSTGWPRRHQTRRRRRAGRRGAAHRAPLLGARRDRPDARDGSLAPRTRRADPRLRYPCHDPAARRLHDQRVRLAARHRRRWLRPRPKRARSLRPHRRRRHRRRRRGRADRGRPRGRGLRPHRRRPAHPRRAGRDPGQGDGPRPDGAGRGDAGGGRPGPVPHRGADGAGRRDRRGFALMREGAMAFRTDTVARLLGRPPQTFADWCARNADPFSSRRRPPDA